jgi:hypothetical protein
MGASRIGWVRAAAIGAGIASAAAISAARAQAPLDPEVAAITSCLCLHRAVTMLSADVRARTGALDALRRQLAGLDAELASEKPKVDLNNPDSVARFRALLERRDAAYRGSVGPVDSTAAAAVARYNLRVGQYNRDCANRPFDAALMRQIETALVCPAPR